MVRIEMLFAAPIPRGHRVRVTWYDEPEREYGFMTDELIGHREMTAEPAVEDLETGVLYGPMRLFLERDNEFVRGELNTLGVEPGEDYRAGRELEGRVLGARIVTAQQGEWHQVQTTLTVEEETETGPYR